MIEKMNELFEELIDLQHKMEEELPSSYVKKMDTITGKFENLMIAVSEYERGQK